MKKKKKIKIDYRPDDIESAVIEQRKTRKNNKADIKAQIVEAVKSGNNEKANKLRKVLLNG